MRRRPPDRPRQRSFCPARRQWWTENDDLEAFFAELIDSIQQPDERNDMNHDDTHFEVEPYVPGGRPRLRHHANALIDRVGLSLDDAIDVLDAIEDAVVDGVVLGEEVVLPRVGAVTEDMVHVGGYVGPVRVGHGARFPILVEGLDAARITPATITAALDVLAEMIEGASPDAAVFVPGVGYHGSAEAIAAVEQEDLADELARLAQPGTSIWVLQANPKVFDISSFLDGTDTIENWSVSRYLDDIREGDRVVFWVSGEQAGVYALGEVTGAPFEGEVDQANLLDASHDWRWLVPIELTVELWDAPVLRSDLKADDRFADESIIRIPGAANPHPLSTSAFTAILERVAT
jgi:hypothetical protein